MWRYWRNPRMCNHPERGLDDTLYIKLIDGATPPKPRVYKMSPAEFTYLKNLRGTWLKVLYDLAVVLGLHPCCLQESPMDHYECADYRGLNALTIKERYPRYQELTSS